MLKNEQSVYRGEAKAIQFAALHLPAGADVTSDCKGAVARSRTGCNIKGRNLDIFGTAPTEHLDLHWVPSHLTESQFRDKVGPNQDWRRVINAEVDQLVGERALSLLPEGCQAALEKRDSLATSVACFLGRRMQALWSYDKDQGPQVLFPGPAKTVDSTGTSGSSASRSAFQKEAAQRHYRQNPTAKRGTSSLVQVASAPNGGQAELNYPGPGGHGAVSEQNPPRKGPVANKKQILLSLVDGSRDARGHRFATTRDTSNNLQIKCEDCGLWIQQTDSKSVFNRKVANYCKNHPLSTPSADWGWHASHNMCNEGFRWKCTRCQGVQAAGGLTPATLERVLCSWHVIYLT